MTGTIRHFLARSLGLVTILVVVSGVAMIGADPGVMAAPSADELKQRVASAEAEATEMREGLASARQRMFEAESEADAAAAELERVENRLALGEQRSERLAERVRSANTRLRSERKRLRRARSVLAERLVAIYMAGPARAEDVAIGAADYNQFLLGSEYMAAIENADGHLARRVEQVRERVLDELNELRRDRAAAERHRAILAADRDRIGAISRAAESRAGALREAAAERDARLAELTQKMDRWAAEVERAERREARQARESAAAETGSEAVDRWLGGPYSIPTAIVMCESGGNYSALNPSSGAGGAYQIIPSTWAAYGGEGLAHQASKAEQDRIAALIWADSGPKAWVCKA